MQKEGQPMMASHSEMRAVAFGRTSAGQRLDHLTNSESELH